MRVRVDGSWFTPDNYLLDAGVWEVPDDWELPNIAEKVDDDTPIGATNLDYSQAPEQSLSSFARLSQEQSSELRSENKFMKQEIQKLTKRISELEKG